MNNSCRLNIPYPEIKVENKDIKTARILMPLYCGRNSELTAVNTYLYQSIITREKNAKTSELIECISMCEMKHYRMLAELINMLGLNPFPAILSQRRPNYWNTSYISPSTDIVKFTQDNINAEKNAIKEYRFAISKIKDEGIIELLERIIKDEEHHIMLFNTVLENVIE